MMRLISTLLCFALSSTLFAQTKVKWFKNVHKAQAVCYAYDKGDTLLGRANAVFIGKEGQILTQYDILRDATRIDVITADGKKTTVTAIASASSIYNIARLQTAEKMTGVSIAPTDGIVNLPVFIMPPLSTTKQTLVKDANIIKVDNIDGNHHYYTIQGQNKSESDVTLSTVFNANEEGLPILNADGNLIAVTQHDHTAIANKEQLYGVSARQINEMTLNGTTILGNDYLRLSLPILLPPNQQQAETTLFLMPRTDKQRYVAMLRQYIRNYPQATFGYTTLAEFYATNEDIDASNAIYEEGLNAVKDKGRDEILFSWSRTLSADSTTLPQALELVNQAIKLNPQPIYVKLAADILFAQRDFENARKIYLDLTNTPLRTPEMFLAAAYCTPPSDSSYIALLDSTIACYQKPYPNEAVTALWLRAAARHDAGLYRPAVSDYNEFEHIVSGRVSAEFFYRRSLSELAGRLYQQALDDAQKAVERQSDNSLLLIHLANIYIRIGESDKARPLLQQAADMGEPAAQEWLDKHK